MKVETVRLELLRPGSPYGSLLSPDTRYYALCGDHPQEEFRVPYEHYQFLRRLATLRYRTDSDYLELETMEIRATLTKMLAGLSCLTRELTAASLDADLIELRLVISAAELAMLPFELAIQPGTRGLADKPIVIVRRTRRARPRRRMTSEAWPEKPRILFAYAAPPGAGSIPVERNALALRTAMQPWLEHVVGLEELDEVRKHIDILPNASPDSLSKKCANNKFSYVHLLAHGKEVGRVSTGELSYKIALHDSGDPAKMHLASGEDLSTYLSGGCQGQPDRLPTVVTIASCDSGNVGSVGMPVGSVAHQLHDFGVPFVVASQLPLSFKGSARMAQCLYEHLLWNKDPREALHGTRQALLGLSNHRIGSLDWASMVAYGAFTADFEKSLSKPRTRQVRRATDSAIAIVDRFVYPRQTVETPDVERAGEAIRKALEKLNQGSVEEHWYEASVAKRWAEALARSAPEGRADEIDQLLCRASEKYFDVYRVDGAPSAIVQYLATEAFRGNAPVQDLLNGTRFLLKKLRSEEPDPETKREYGRALIEIELLDPETKPDWARQIDDLFEGTKVWTEFEFYSLRRQLQRYILWRDPGGRAANLDALLSGRGALNTWDAIVDWRTNEFGYLVTRPREKERTVFDPKD